MDNILNERNNGWAFAGKVPSWASFRLPGTGDHFGVWYFGTINIIIALRELHSYTL